MREERSNYINSLTLALIGSFLIIGLYVAWLIVRPAGNVSTSEIAAGQSQSKVYKNDQNGFEFSYPSNWLEFKGDTSGLGEGLSGGIKRVKPAVVGGVRVTGSSDKANIETTPQVLDGEMAKSFKQFKKISQEFVNVGQYKALRYTYTFKSANNITVKQMQQIVVKGNKVFYLIFHSSITGFDKAQPEINEIADSFKLN
jgi:hypothetical protein